MMVDHITNCPNCGGVLHDCICDYCGTVMPVNIDDFIGKRALLVSIDDNDDIIFSAIDVRRVERNDNYGNPDYKIAYIPAIDFIIAFITNEAMVAV